MSWPDPHSVPEVGIYPGVPEWVYRSWVAVNQSSLCPFAESAAHAYDAFHNPKEPTPAMDQGQAIHTVLLEPDLLDERFALRPEGIDRRTKEGKAIWAEFVAESEGKTIIEKPKIMEVLRSVSDGIQAHPLASHLIHNAAMREVSIVWEDPGTGLLCKARIDVVGQCEFGRYDGWAYVGDLKSSKSANPRKFSYSVYDYGYHIQAASYVRGLNVLSPFDRQFFIVVAETAPPYLVECYALDESAMLYGEQLYDEYLQKWKECSESGIWPGYHPDGDVHVLDTPEWVDKVLSR